MKALALAVMLLGWGAVNAEATADSGFTNAGISCRTHGINTTCIPVKGYGYGIGIARDVVVVVKLPAGKSVFKREQP